MHHSISQMKHQTDATLCRFYFCRVTLYVSGASAHHQEYLKLAQRPLVHVLSLQVSHHISLLGPERRISCVQNVIKLYSLGNKGKIQRMLMIFLHAIYPVISSHWLLIHLYSRIPQKIFPPPECFIYILQRKHILRSRITVGQYHIRGPVSEVPQQFKRTYLKSSGNNMKVQSCSKYICCDAGSDCAHKPQAW